MKKILIGLLLLTAGVANAQHHYGHGHHHGQWRHSGSGWVWVVPTIIGGVIGYEMAKNQPTVVQQPIIIQTPTGTQECSPWTETMNPDGSITRTRTCK
jgi:hypothetical protein